jgi:protein-disulfide isomerase
MKKNLNTIISIFVIIVLIIIGFLLLRDSEPNKVVEENSDQVETQEIEIKQISSEDHILGNKDARIQVITYSDTQCPYCGLFYDTVNQIINERGEEIAWVYRHYPIPQLHPTAPKDSEALECAFEQGGEDAFWGFSDELYLGEYGNNDTKLVTIAEKLGLEKDSFQTCLEEERYKERVNSDIEEANKLGITGTPTSLILVDGELATSLPGALPYENVSEVLDLLISE